MALPTTISADREFAPNQSFGGPFQIGGKTYVVIADVDTASDADSFIYVYGTTDPVGGSWTLEDSSQRDAGDSIKSFWAVEDGTDIQIYAMGLDAVGGLMHSTFDTVTDAFTTDLTQITAVVDDLLTDNLFVSASIRSDGDQIVLFSGDSEAVHGTDYARIDYVREEGAGWSSAISVDGGSTTHFNYGTVVKAESDKMQFAYYIAFTLDINANNLNSSNTLSSVDTVVASVTDGKRMFGGGAYYLDGSVDKVRISLWDASLTAGNELTEVYIDDDVVNSSLQNAGWEDSTVLTDDIQKHWMSEVMQGTKRYIMYIDDGNDINYTVIDDDGTPAADVEAIALTDCNGLFCRVIDRSGDKLAYVYDDAGTIKYNEVDIAESGDQTLTPSIVSPTVNIHVPTVTTGAVTLVASLLISLVAIFAPQVNLGLAAPLVSPTVSIYAPTVTTGAVTLTPTNIGSMVSIFAPTITTGPVTLSVPLVSPTVTIYTPQVNLGMAPPLVNALVTIHVPVVTTGSVTLSPSLIGSMVVIYVPVVTQPSDEQTLVPSLLSSMVAVHTPQLNLGLSASLVSPTVNIYTPTVTTGSVTLSPSLIGSMVAVHAPTITTGSVALTPSLISSIVAVYTPQVNLGLTASLLSPAVNIYTPTITVGSVTLSPSLVSPTVNVYVPTVTTGSVTLSPSLIGSMAVIYNPQVNLGLTASLVSPTVTIYNPQVNLGLIASLVSPTVNIYVPTITTGSVTLSPSLISSIVAVYTPQVNLGLTASLVSPTVNIFAPQVNLGLTASLVSPTVNIYVPVVTQSSQPLAPSLIGNMVAVYAPTITVGSVTLAPGLVSPTVSVYTPQVNLGLTASLVSPTVNIYAPTINLEVFPSLVDSMVAVHVPVITTGSVTLAPSLVNSMVVIDVPTVRHFWEDIDSSTTPSWGDVDAVTNPSYSNVDSATSPSYSDVDSAFSPSWVCIDEAISPGWVCVDDNVQRIGASFLNNITNIYAATITTGSATLSPSLVGSMATIYAPTVKYDQTLAPSLVVSMATIYAPVVKHSIVLGNVTVGQDITSTHTLSHDNSTPAKDFLIAGGTGMALGSVPVSTFQYNGASMTEIGTQKTESLLQSAHFSYKLNPASGTNDFTFTSTGTPNDYVIWAQSFDNVHQSTPIGAEVNVQGSTEDPSTSITTTAANSYLLAFVSWEDTDPAPTEDSGEGWSVQVDQDGDNTTIGRVQVWVLPAPTVKSYNFNLQTTTSDDYIIRIVEILIA